MPKEAKKYVVGKSKIHGNGVFAACDIKEGERIIEYLGEKFPKRNPTAAVWRMKNAQKPPDREQCTFLNWRTNGI